MDKEDLISSGLIEQYVLGLTSPEESAMVEACAKRYPEVHHHIQKMRDGVEQYALSQHIPNQKKKTELPSDENEWEMEERINWGRVAFAAFVVVGLIAAWITYRGTGHVDTEIAELNFDLEKLKEQHEALSAQHALLTQRFDFLKHHETRQVNLLENEQDSQPEGLIFFNPQSKECALQSIDMPSCPKDHYYIVWATVDGEHHRVGGLSGLPDPEKMYTLDFVGEPQAFLVTLEDNENKKIPNSARIMWSGMVN